MARSLRTGAADAPDGVEEATIAGLDWLRDQQNPDGSFGTKYHHAMTGLALMALAGHGESPESESYGATVFHAIGRGFELG